MFSDIKKAMQAKFTEMAKLGTLYYVEVDRDEIWNTYLNAIPEAERQGNNCNCCKSFLRQFGSIVAIKDNLVVTLWDFMTEDPEYADAIKALRKYIVSRPIKNVFLNTFEKCGTDKNPDKVKGVVWEHFFLKLPSAFIKSEAQVGPIQANALGNKEVLERSLNEITDDAVDTVLELIGQDSIYRGAEFKGMVSEFKKIKERYKKIKGAVPKSNFCWAESVTATPAVTRIKNSAIGTLLNDLSEGRELDSAVAAFEKVVAPTNYRRPANTLVTPKMIDAAKLRLEELGLTGSLYRRMLSEKDLTVNNALFVHRNSSIEGDVFDQIKRDAVINPKTFSKIEEISVGDFIKKIVPTAKSIKVLVENRHLNSLVSLVGPKNNDDKVLFKHGNQYSWSYTGGVADSIKERVKQAGGKVDGIARISLSWDNSDDLDLHLFEPNGGHVYYPNKRIKSSSGAVLDLDANGGDGIKENPCENIYWQSLPIKSGEYKVVVNQWSQREVGKQGFEVEAEFEGQTYNFSFKSNGSSGVQHQIFTFNYSPAKGFVITSAGGKEGSYKSTEKWKIKSGQFHLVKALTLSPNYWGDKGIGNKHFFFLLENCVSDEVTRGFYNEMIHQELDKDRRVFEVLGSRIKVEPVENELSGLGFSETVRTDLIVEVEGNFKRNLKIKF